MSLPNPLVSCLMPTNATRQEHIADSLNCYASQTHQNRELIIVVDNGESIDLGEHAERSDTRVVTCKTKLSLGAKTNLACANAKGEIFIRWEDDDWYANDRIERQILPIISAKAHATMIRASEVLVKPTKERWVLTKQFLCVPHDGTLAFLAGLWNPDNLFQDTDLVSTVGFIIMCLWKYHARIMELENEGSYLWGRCPQNMWNVDLAEIAERITA